jgi:hypothetical protein
MSAWSVVIALSGFHYHGADKAINLIPKTGGPRFASFWSTGSGWGLFSVIRESAQSRIELAVTEGLLRLKSIRTGRTSAASTAVVLGNRRYPHKVRTQGDSTILELAEDVVVPAGGKLLVVV